MRDPQRLDRIYNEILRIHKKYYPDLRFYQFMYYFCKLSSEINNGKDIYYLEDDKLFDLINKIEEKIKERKGYEDIRFS